MLFRSVLQRISELKLLSTDVTKSASDIANYNAEFLALQSQLTSTAAGTFNGVALFAAGAVATTLAVGVSEDGAQTLNISQSALSNAVGLGAGAAGTNPGSAASIGALVLATTTAAIQNVATARAQNGAETSRLGFNADMLATNRTNLEAANSRIVDTDVAMESTKLARNNILVQAGSAMLAQANSSSQSVMRLLQ